MYIPKITLHGHVEHNFTLSNASHASAEQFSDNDLSFLDWLTEVTPAAAQAQAVTAPISIEDELKKEELEAQSLWFKSEAKTVDNLEVAETSTSDEDSSPKEVLHLLNDALTPVDSQYLKQFVIPNVPIIMGSVPFQQLFPGSSDENNISYQGFEVSENLRALIEKGVKTGAPIRVELDKNASIVLKFKNGRVSAEFLSNDNVGAWVVKQQLETLKQQLLSKNLPVEDLTYRQQQKKEQQQLQQQAQQENTEPDA